MLDIKQTLLDFGNAVTSKDIDTAYRVFDTGANVILAGSAKDELHRGNEAIRKFLEELFAQPFRVSWDLGNMSVDQNNDTAWIFVDGSATVKKDDGKEEKMPYRIAVIMVKKESIWKWRLFNGSVPQMD